jgi:hypothetical protein
MDNIVPWYTILSNTTTLFFSKRGDGSGVGGVLGGVDIQDPIFFGTYQKNEKNCATGKVPK